MAGRPWFRDCRRLSECGEKRVSVSGRRTKITVVIMEGRPNCPERRFFGRRGTRDTNRLYCFPLPASCFPIPVKRCRVLDGPMSGR
jgi:hypothetical protein